VENIRERDNNSTTTEIETSFKVKDKDELQDITADVSAVEKSWTDDSITTIAEIEAQKEFILISKSFLLTKEFFKLQQKDIDTGW